MLPCTCEIDNYGFVIWDINCPIHGILNIKEDKEDGKE